jgi:hypothetical protein
VTERFHTISAKGARLVLDLAVGHVRAFEVEQAGKRVTPLHTAPWVDDPAVAADPDILPNLKYLSGDFFCAPFGKSDVEAGSPVSHGWPANSSWSFAGGEARGPAKTARFELDRRVLGARLVKEITLRDGHPFAYERHVFHGGEGAISVASHAMTRFDAPGRLSFSAKAYGELPDAQSEPDPKRGRSRFAKGVRFNDLGRIPLADGTTADLGRYPVADRHEDFVMLVEAQAAGLGWTAAVRPGAGDIMLSLKNPRDFPVTFLWYSNGGRDYAPWNGRHVGVLGIEEGRAWAGYGHAASIAPNPLSRSGIPTSLTLIPGGSVAVSHVIGGLRLPQGWEKVASVTAGQGALRLTGDAAGELSVPFDTGFLAG